MTIDLEGELRSLLAGKADSLNARPGQYDPYPGTARRVRRARTRRRLLTSALAVTAVAAVAVPALTATPGGDRVAPQTPVAEWPTRGSLAADTAFVSAVARQAGGGRVLYAGDDGVHRVALAYQVTKTAAAMTTMFYGQTGEPVVKLTKSESFSSQSGHGIGPASPFVWVSPPQKSVDTMRTLLVVGDPSMRNLRLSPSILVGPGPSLRRVGHRIAISRGATLTEVKGMRKPRLKATLGHRTFELPAPVSGPEPPADEQSLADLSALQRQVTNIGGWNASLLWLEARGGLGVDPSTIKFEIPWSGTIDGLSTLIARVTAPGLPTFQVVQYTKPRPDEGALSKIFVGPATKSVGWPVVDPTATGNTQTDGAVLAPGLPGLRVMLSLHGKKVAEGRTDGQGLATFRLKGGLTETQFGHVMYQVLDDHDIVRAVGAMNAAAYGDQFDVKKW